MFATSDSYRSSFIARIVDMRDGSLLLLDATYFYPASGGQPHDLGVLRRKSDGRAFRVLLVKKSEEGILHQVDVPGLVSGDEVEAAIDWGRRYRLMRSHTAAHLVSALIRGRTNALITGNQLATDKVRIDFGLDEYDPAMFEGIIEEANGLIEKGAPLSFSFVTRAEAVEQPELVGLAKGLPEHERIRVVEITGLDRQACGGTHVKDIKEIGPLLFLKAENKGAKNRRVYFALAD